MSLNIGLGTVLTVMLLLAVNVVHAIVFRKYYADKVIVNYLINAIVELQNSVGSAWTMQQKRAIILDLETASFCVEHGLPYRLQCRDPETMLWNKQVFKEIATTIRLTNRWIISPKADTREFLNQRLITFLEHSLTGEWDSMERTQPEDLAIHLSLKARIWEVCRTLILAALPPLGAFAYHLMHPKAELPALVTGVVVLWPILILAAAVDPDFKSKVAIFKDATALLPLSSRDKK